MEDRTTGKLRCFIKTYGCQMNSRDSENMASMMEEAGFLPASGIDDAGIVVFNTCCVRESAEDRFFGHLSRLKPVKAKRPELVIAISGCMSQQEKMKSFIEKKHPYVDIVIGTGNRHLLPVLVKEVMENRKSVYDTSGVDAMPGGVFNPASREHRHKAGINIMYGCSNFCSYCIVPYVRGPERSRGKEEIAGEAKLLAEDGVKEIMLLGQNVNSYGKGTGSSFAELARLVSEIDGIRRIRFMTSHPKDFSSELVKALRDLPKMCKHVHLPLQAGSTKVLKDMNRGYSKEDYLALVAKIKTEVPGAAITTDIIVGFPGETEDDFADTLDVVRKARFSGAFTFIYSKRSGTPAASLENAVPEDVSKMRFERLTSALYPFMREFNEEKLGLVYAAMVDEADEGGNCKGRLDDHTLVHFFAGDPPPQPGSFVRVKITEARTFYVLGAMEQ